MTNHDRLIGAVNAGTLDFAGTAKRELAGPTVRDYPRFATCPPCLEYLRAVPSSRLSEYLSGPNEGDGHWSLEGSAACFTNAISRH